MDAGNESARLHLVLTRAPWSDCTRPPAAPVESQDGDLAVLTVGLAAAGAAALCAATAGLVCWRRRRRLLRKAAEQSADAGDASTAASETTATAALDSSALFVSGNLVDVVSRGIAEHWIVPPSDLELLSVKAMSGGFGDVRKARLMKSADVAIKICKDLDGPGGASASAAIALKNEIRIFRRVRHANIVLFYGVTVMQGGALGLVLEWVAGGDFGAFVVKRRKSGDYVSDLHACRVAGVALPEWKLLQDVARGLAFLHSQTPPILHRDLKPNNVLVEDTNPPKAKLTDFGLSILMPEGREVHARAGTRCYMAPEVMSRRVYGIAADVYSLGCVMVFATSGRSPPVGGAMGVAKELEAAAEEDFAAAVAFAVLAVDCLQVDPGSRPLVSDALTRLGDIAISEQILGHSSS